MTGLTAEAGSGDAMPSPVRRCPRSVVPTHSTAALLLAEPFRLFFPWAMLCGISGALLWPAFYAHLIPWYPGLVHARIMIESLGGGFVLGFLATSLPRMLGAKPFAPWPIALLAAFHAASWGALMAGNSRLGDALFAAALSWLAAMTIDRFLRRTDLPPPSFFLVAAGVSAGLFGSLVSAAGWDLTGPPWLWRFGRLALQQGFLIPPVLGVSAFLLPRILQLPSRASFPDGRLPSARWCLHAAAAAAVGGLILSSLVIESIGWERSANGLRSIVVLAWLGWMLPGWWKVRAGGTQAWAARVALACLASGLLLRAILPVEWNRVLGLEHIVFIGGYGVIFIAVGARITHGHSGQRTLAAGKSIALRWIVWLVLVAMATRASADYFPRIVMSHHIYAALLWAVAAGVWLIWLAGAWLRPDPEG